MLAQDINTDDGAKSDKNHFGLAMHGDAKYSADDTHLTYANPEAPKGGTLKHAAIGTFDTLNPYTIKGKAAQGLNLVYDRLMARVWDEPFTMYPLIAERVDVADNRSAITFYINTKARFHDGSPITADDVLFSFETLKTSGRPNMRQIYKLVKVAEKRGALTVHFEFGEGYDQETVMILAMMPILSKAYWEGRDFESTTLEPPIANGPYKIASVDAGRRVTYERIQDYWAADLLTNAGHHNFDRIIYDYYRDDTVAFEAFKSGDIDLRREFNAGKWVSTYDFPAIDSGEIKAEALSHSRPERVKALIFNTRRAPFNDIRVRKALSLLLDFDWINKNLFYGEYKRISSFYPNSELAAPVAPSDAELDLLSPYRNQLDRSVFGTLPEPSQNTTAANLRKNMRAADRLLRDAGWIVENGRRVKDSNPFSFELILGAPEEEKIALHYKRTLDKLGIDITIRVMDLAAYTGRLQEYNFDMTLYHWLSSLSPGTEQSLYWGCGAADQPGRWNYAGICDPVIDILASQIAFAETRQDLVTHVHALDRLLLHGHYMVPLYYLGKDYVAYRNYIKRPDTTPLYGMVLETWWSIISQTGYQN